MAANPRIKLPDNVKIGDVIEVKTLITHVMETGNRHDKDGKSDPARHHQHVRRQVRRQRSVPRRAWVRHLRQSLHLVSDARAGARCLRIRLDRRPRRHDGRDHAAQRCIVSAVILERLSAAMSVRGSSVRSAEGTILRLRQVLRWIPGLRCAFRRTRPRMTSTGASLTRCARRPSAACN